MKRLLSYIFIISFGFFLGFMLIEIGFRVFEIGCDDFFKKDPYIGHFHIPGKEGIYSKWCFKTKIKINSKGLRDVEHIQKKAKGVYRIVILGDSYAEAFQVRLEESFPRVLENLLNKESITNKYEVINLGCSGFGTDQEYLSLKYYGLQYEPDLVILTLLTGNDVRNNHYILDEHKNKPYFDISEDGKLIQRPFYTSLSKSFVKTILKKSRLLVTLYIKATESQRFLRFLEKLGLAQEKRLKQTQVLERDKDNELLPFDYHVYLYDYSEDWERAWDITKELIKATKGLAVKNNAEFMLVTLTDPAQMRDDEEIDKLASEGYDIERPVEILEEFSKRNNINYLPLFYSFREYMLKNGLQFEDIHLDCDGHWTALSHEIAAQFIKERIETLISAGK